VTAAEVVGSNGKHLGSSKNVRKQRVLTEDEKTGWWDELRSWTGNSDLWSQCDGGGGGGKQWETPGKFEKSKKMEGFDCG
jgi:hypothetical protein